MECAEKRCPGRGCETTVIGYTESEQLDGAGAEFRAGHTAREACMRQLRQPYGECGSVAGTHGGKRFGERPVGDPNGGGEILRSPLYRQAAMLEREAGVEINRATLDGWVMLSDGA